MSSRIRYLRAEDVREVIYWEAPHLEEGEISEKFSESPVLDKNLFVDENNAENNFKEEKAALDLEKVQEVLDKEREEIFAQSYAEGKKLGQDEGFSEGFAKGFAEGQTAGFLEGEKQGREKGFGEGKVLALSEAKEQFIPLWQALESAITQLQKPIAEQELALAEEINALIIAIVKAVIGMEIKTNPAIVLESVRKGLLALPTTAQEGVVYVNPEDKKCIEELGEIPSSFRLQADVHIPRGGARIEARSSLVDATPDRRLQRVLEEVFGHGDHE